MDEASKVTDDKYEWVDGKRVKPDWRYWYERAKWWAAKAKEFGYCPDRGVLQARDLTRAQQEAGPADLTDEAIGRIADRVYAELRKNGYTGAQGGVWWNKAMYAAGFNAAYTAPQPRIDPEIRRFIEECAAVRGKMVGGNILSARAGRLLALIAEQGA